MALDEIASVHVAALYDALQRAAKIAPTKGAAYDKAQGIQLTLIEGGIEVRATDLEITYFELIDADVRVPGEVYRLPAQVLPPFIASIPMKKDTDMVKILVDANDKSKVVFRYNKTKLKANIKRIVGSSFPEFGPIRLDGMTPAQELASSVEAVAWATDDSGKYSGVQITGSELVAIDGKVAARINCAVETPEPILAPLKPLVPLIKGGTNIHIRGMENRLVIALDERTQITTALFLEPFGDILERMKSFELPDQFTISRTRLIEALTRVLTFLKSSDRLPVCELAVIEGSLEVNLFSDSGQVQDACVLTDQVRSADKTFKFNPNRLLEALNSFTSSTVTVHYTPEYPTRKPVHIVNPSGEYEAWVIPMADTA